MIYIVANSKNAEQIREIIDKFPDDEVKVVNSVDEVPEEARSLGYAEPITYLKPPPVVDIADALIASQGSEYSKLCSLDNKTKNKARRKIERRALNYFNRHCKK